jgi:hypothetical protein
MMWYNMIRYDMIWYDTWYMIWYMMWYDMIRWYDTWYMIWYMISNVIYDMVYDMIWCMMWHDMIRHMIWCMMWYDIFVNCNGVDTRWQQYSTHLHTNSTQNDTMKQNIQNRTYITIRIHKYNNKNTQFTKLNRNTQNTQPYIQWYKMEPKQYERIL